MTTEPTKALREIRQRLTEEADAHQGSEHPTDQRIAAHYREEAHLFSEAIRLLKQADDVGARRQSLREGKGEMGTRIADGEYRFKGSADARDMTPGLRSPHAHRVTIDGDLVLLCDCQACKVYWEGYFASRPQTDA